MLLVNKAGYRERLHGFWLGLSIANWTGLVTEMDKIGGPGPAGKFYTRDDWGKPDQPSIWGQGVPSQLSPTIDWVLRGPDEAWGADDDSDIEYIYLKLMQESPSPLLDGEQIRQGWLEHIYTDANTPHRNQEGQPENFLWVSNQQAFDLMQRGMVPPLTGTPPWNPNYDMIDAQLTTELFGALSPGRPDVALRLAHLPIRTTAYGEAADIAQFYVHLHAMAATVDRQQLLAPQVMTWAMQARKQLPSHQYPARMFDFVYEQFASGRPWEQVRDALYQRYQVEQQDNYRITDKKLYCNGCFAAGINFAASLVSLFYGAGDFQDTVKIAVLAGWDSDNPAATWGGLYGLILGKQGVERRFGRKFATAFNIHRTRRGFANGGVDDFDSMARAGETVIDKVIRQLAGGESTADGQCWRIPAPPR